MANDILARAVPTVGIIGAVTSANELAGKVGVRIVQVLSERLGDHNGEGC